MIWLRSPLNQSLLRSSGKRLYVHSDSETYEAFDILTIMI